VKNKITSEKFPAANKISLRVLCQISKFVLTIEDYLKVYP